ncbi:MAG: response regulator [Thermodesulfobacteriota bacterium]|jgi:DNA-binding response OmpR family regulator
MDSILIIQDSPSVNAMLKFRLERGGFAVDTAETGEEGIEKTKTFQYHLILLDYNLPGINGSQVCEVLKKRDNTRNIPIVFISAKDEDKLSQITREAGADGYIGLPFEGKKFIEKITDLLKKRRS